MKVKLNLSLDPWVKQKLKGQADDKHRDMSEHVKELVLAEEKRGRRRIK